MTMIYDLKQSLARQVQQTLANVFGIGEDQYRVSVQYPARPEFGDFSFAFPFELARVLRSAPAKIAARFVETFTPPPEVRKVEIAGGGYVNLHLDTWAIFREALAHLREGRFWLSFEPDPEKYIVEHTNINPNKAAHVGHLRNSVLGDGLVRLMQANGKRVEVQNYIDNTGVQVADVVVGFLHIEGLNLEQVKAIPGRFDYYCWELYARVAHFYEESEENQRRRSEVLQQIEDGHGEAAELAEHVATRIVHCHLDTMERLGIRYDVLPRESDILHLHFWDSAFSLLKQRGAVTFEEDGPNRGCWVMKYEKDGQEDVKIIVRSNGTVTYTGKDIAYQLWKLGRLGRDFHYTPFRKYPDGHVVWCSASSQGDAAEHPPVFGNGQWVFNVIDARQAYTQNVVYEGVRRLGYPEEAAHSVHFAYEMVALSPRCALDLGFRLSDEERQRSHVEVSGRRGLGVKADDLLDRLEEKARIEVQQRNPDLEPAAVDRIARQIAVGALRYFMVKFSRNALIVFDFEDCLNFDGETGPYLQYSAVRARNILQKYREAYDHGEADSGEIWSSLLDAPPQEIPADIWELLSQILKMRDVARASLASQEISTFARYLYGLTQRFSNFYNKHRIIGEADVTRRLVLLAVVDIYHKGIIAGMDILGIPVPDRM
jgi:arginyl-tRNA synthetase